MPSIASARTNDLRKEVGLPPIIFFFTVDQIASMLGLTEESIMARYLHFVGRTPGKQDLSLMAAINIAVESTDKPVWRVESKEFVRFLRRRGFVIRGGVR